LGATTTSPIQVTSNGVALASVASAQSAYKKYSPYQLASVGRVFIRLDINVSAATNGSDIFLVNREYDNVSTNTTYLQPAGKSHFRTFIKSTNSGYVIGWNPNSASTNTTMPVYETNVRTFRQTYTILMRYDALSGTSANDASYMAIDPVWNADPTSLPWISALQTSNWAGNTSTTNTAATTNTTVPTGEFSSFVPNATNRACGILAFVLKQNAGNALTVSKISLGDTLADVGILPSSVPAAPGVTSGSAITLNGFTANWSASENTEYYSLEVATATSPSPTYLSGYPKNVGNATSASIALTPGSYAAGDKLYYRVRASNPLGFGTYSSWQMVTLVAATLPQVSNTNGSGVVTWTNSEGWTPNKPVSATNATVTFTGELSSATLEARNDAGNFQLNSLVFSNTGSGNVNVLGNPLQFTSNGSTTPTIAFANTNTVIQNVQNDLQLNAALTVSQAGATYAANSILSGVISGTSGLTKSGNGFVDLTGTNNSFGGGVTVGAGTLVVGSIGTAGLNSSLGTNGAISLGATTAAGTLRWGDYATGNETSDKAINLVGTTGGGTIDVRGNNMLTLSGAINTGTDTNSRTFTLFSAGQYVDPNDGTSNSIVVNSWISGKGGLTISGHADGDRTVRLNNTTNSFGGPFSIACMTNNNNIFLRVWVEKIGMAGGNSPLGTNKTINIGNNKNNNYNMLYYSGAGETNDKTINLSGTVGSASIINKGVGTLKFTAPVTATGVGAKTIFPDEDQLTGVTEFAGNIPNSATNGLTQIKKSGVGKLVLSASNSFTGGMRLAGGTLELNHSNALAAGNYLRFEGYSSNGVALVKVGYSGDSPVLGNLELSNTTLPFNIATIDLGTNSSSSIRFATATGWYVDKTLTLMNSMGGGKLYILDTNTVSLTNIVSAENPTLPANITTAGRVYFGNPPASAPKGIALTLSTIAENNAASAPVGIFSTTRDSGTNPLTYTIVPSTDYPDYTSFSILNGNLVAAVVFNYEAKSSYSILVRSTDSDGFSIDVPLTIQVTDVNEGPTVTSLATASVAENTTAVMTVTATDPDLNATLNYSIQGGADQAVFTIVPSTGVLTFKAAPDFENPTDSGANNVYDVIVGVSDGTNTGTKAVTVTVTDVVEQTLQEAYLATFGLTGANALPTADPDGDGLNNAGEFAFGTSPIDGSSRAVQQTSVAGGIKITWLQRAGVTYTVKSGTDLSAGLNGSVTPLPSAVQPSPGQVGYTQYEATYTAPAPATKGFLKVQADVP
jgi:autotransporter-associated beta strand protein